MSSWARRQLYFKRKNEPVEDKEDKEEDLDSRTGKEEWENEYDKEEMYENPFS